MHALLSAFVQAGTTTTTTSGSKSSSSTYFFLILIVIFAAVYFLFLRPRQQRMRQQQANTRQLQLGDEVMSAGGIYGTVVDLHEDSVDVEVADGVVLTFTRRAISPRPQGGGTAGAGRPAFGRSRGVPEPADEDAETGGGDELGEEGGDEPPPDITRD